MQIPANLMIWLLFILIQLVNAWLMLIGWVIIAPLSWAKAWTERPSRVYPDRFVTVWRGGWLTWLWGNEEDGILGKEWGNPRPYYWSAIRNPVNNLRFVPGVSKVGRPLFRRLWSIGGRPFYFQAGWNEAGYPVLSAGANSR